MKTGRFQLGTLHCTLAVVAAFTLAPVAAHAARLTVAEPADIRSTNPGVNRDNTTDGVVVHMVEGLVGYRNDGSVAPLLARSVDVSDDGLTYTFALRKGVKFHNGQEMTSADVVWSWNRYMDPQTGWRCISDFDGRGIVKVTGIEAPDAYTVVMTIEHKSAVFLDTLARADCGMTAVLNKESVNADGSWNKPIGTGPFQFKEWKRGEYVDLIAFPGYQSPGGDKPDGYVGAKQPKVDELRFVVVPDPSTVKAGLQSGALDAAQVARTDFAELRADKRVHLEYPQEASKHVLLFQTDDPLLGNVKMRQAIAAALDIPQIVAVASEGIGRVNPSAVYAASTFHSKLHDTGYQYDPARAKQLLKEAGYKGQELVLQANKRGHVPSYQIAVMVQAMLQAVGINTRIDVLEWATHLDRFNTGKFQLSSFSYSTRMDPALSYEQFSGDKTKQPRKVWGDPQAQTLIDQSFEESDPVKRQAIFDQLHELMLAQAPMIMLYNGADPWGVNKRVSGFSVFEGKPRAWETSVAQ